MRIFYSPTEGRCGDYIPFYWKGEFHLFFIHGSLWRHIGTRDFVDFVDYGVAIPAGAEDAQDRDIWTGCVLEKDGLFHIFYTGHNGEFQKAGLDFEQVVMHATSSDLMTWEKDADWRLAPDLERYSPAAWRDPHVFWNESEQAYWMILTAATRDGLPKRSGCTPLFDSVDLVDWHSRGPIWSPGLYDSHECPDLFKMGDWWYLVFSTYARQWETHYRMAKTPEGPWIAPHDDQIDGRDFYAAKTAASETNRYIIGWQCVKEGEEDGGVYQWGGSLLVHELVQRRDKTLGAKMPDSVGQAFTKEVGLKPEPHLGEWTVGEKEIRAKSAERFSHLNLAKMPETMLFEATVDWKPGTDAFGAMLRVSDANLNGWYQFRIEPERGRVVFDRSNRYFTDHAFIEERPIRLFPSEPVRIGILVSGTTFVLYVQNTVALSARGYDYPAGTLGLFVSEGEAAFTDLSLRRLE